MTVPTRVLMPDHLRGDTWPGFPVIGPVMMDGLPPPSACTQVRMMFRRAADSLTSAYTLSNAPAEGQGTIQILDAALWRFLVPPQPLPLYPANWYWDMEFVDAAGAIWTLLAGTQRVISDTVR